MKYKDLTIAQIESLQKECNQKINDAIRDYQAKTDMEVINVNDINVTGTYVILTKNIIT